MRPPCASSARTMPCFLSSESAHSCSNVSLIQIYDPSTAPAASCVSRIFSASSRAGCTARRCSGRSCAGPVRPRRAVLDRGRELRPRVPRSSHRPAQARRLAPVLHPDVAHPCAPARPEPALVEIYVIEGLDAHRRPAKDSFALLTKLHHAAIDVKRRPRRSPPCCTTQTPRPPPREPPEPWFPSPRRTRSNSPAAGSHAGDVAAASGAGRCGIWSGASARRRVRSRRSCCSGRSDAGDAFQRHRVPLPRVRDAPLPDRRVPRDAPARSRAKNQRCRLAVCAGGLRRYLEANEELPEADLSTLMPVYVRDPEAGPGGRPEVEWERIMLGVTITDPVQRSPSSRDRPSPSKLMSRAIGARELTDIGTHAPAATLAITGKMLGRALLGVGRRAPLANCAVTNGPRAIGPDVLERGAHDVTSPRSCRSTRPRPRLRGDELRRQDHRLADSCREQMPDPEAFAQCLRDCFQNTWRSPARARAPRRGTETR